VPRSLGLISGKHCGLEHLLSESQISRSWQLAQLYLL